jgi:hypothetical protein
VHALDEAATLKLRLHDLNVLTKCVPILWREILESADDSRNLQRILDQSMGLTCPAQRSF